MIAGYLLMVGDPASAQQIKAVTTATTCKAEASIEGAIVTALISWAPCREIDLRLMTVQQLADAGQLDGLESGQKHQLLEQPDGVLLTAWGEFASAIYLNQAKGTSSTQEIFISD